MTSSGQTSAQEVDSVEPVYAHRVDEIGRAAGVEPLRFQAPLPAGHREIRIWVGFGLLELPAADGDSVVVGTTSGLRARG